MPAWKRILWSVLFIGLFSALFMGYQLYQRLYKVNVSETMRADVFYLEIPTGSRWQDVLFLLQQAGVLQDMASFEWVAQRASYPENVLPGRYRIEQQMNNVDLVKLLASGRQEPVRLMINKFRNRFDLYGAVGRKLEADSLQITQLFTDDKYMRKHGFRAENALAMIIPNTYEFWWNTSAEAFVARMYEEYKRFWTESRREQARRLGLSPVEVMVLASIVEEETNKDDEKGTIARVYLNRLEIGMRLQADPTVKFAVGDFAIKRVTGKHLNVDSPFNTYMYAGLPPAPICTPSIRTIDAVLNSIPNDYLYFCAREDFSGYHNFARTYSKHQENARKYQRALNKLNIRG
ncbi:MAG: endolytic transglycosylase MltG [Bacteroidia bacterium]